MAAAAKRGMLAARSRGSTSSSSGSGGVAPFRAAAVGARRTGFPLRRNERAVAVAARRTPKAHNPHQRIAARAPRAVAEGSTAEDMKRKVRLSILSPTRIQAGCSLFLLCTHPSE